MEHEKQPAKLAFEAGTLLLKNLPLSKLPIELLRKIKWDERVECHRCMAYLYAPLVLALRDAGCCYEDNAREFAPLDLDLNTDFQLRTHQQEAFVAWKNAECRAVTALPTGSGKTFLAVTAINYLARPALVLVPTIDLLQQWASQLETFFQQPIGMLGGGAKDIRPITVSTYDSAVIHMEFIGGKFGFLVFDECHHLPGPVNRVAASMSIAPYRLGLTATPELDEEPAEALREYIGPLCCQIHIDQLEGEVLAPYATRQEKVKLDAQEAVAYQQSRKIYVEFLKKHGITFQRRDDWARFIGLCARMPDGRNVLSAFLEQKRIARGGRAKVQRTWEIIQEHRHERIIVFTAENDTAYMLGRKFFMPVLTHRTKVSERKEMLELFRSGEYPVLITSKVLNEGVDVPEASVGIIVSGSGSIREHVQRLGRILRAADGKQAVLYELISEGTSEENVSRRRREHRAYRRSGKFFRRRR
ncbi:DEAD/DEAH box helicase family protein [Lentisphaerota bacterium ZTH]|nr:DEAD/DEAH box helicase family protein [Lentisphaerota bacterium]WET06595.1 DEAD/DEAH box helicase family protein [Lentisphaerota bacterium ZTH]